MKISSVVLTLLIPLACVSGLGAQTSQTESKSKVIVKDGKDVKVTGCVARGAGGSGYILTNVADKTGDLHSYTLVSAEDQLAKHVGHRVQLEGKVADRGDAKVTIETQTKTKVEGNETQRSTVKSNFEGDATGLAYLGVKSVKMIASVCP